MYASNNKRRVSRNLLQQQINDNNSLEKCQNLPNGFNRLSKDQGLKNASHCYFSPPVQQLPNLNETSRSLGVDKLPERNKRNLRNAADRRNSSLNKYSTQQQFMEDQHLNNYNRNKITSAQENSEDLPYTANFNYEDDQQQQIRSFKPIFSKIPKHQEEDISYKDQGAQLTHRFQSIANLTAVQNQNLKKQNQFLIRKLKAAKQKQAKIAKIYDKGKQYKKLYIQVMDGIQMVKQEAYIYSQQVQQIQSITRVDVQRLKKKCTGISRKQKNNNQSRLLTAEDQQFVPDSCSQQFNKKNKLQKQQIPQNTENQYEKCFKLNYISSQRYSGNAQDVGDQKHLSQQNYNNQSE